jgi:hypothetical protein
MSQMNTINTIHYINGKVDYINNKKINNIKSDENEYDWVIDRNPQANLFSNNRQEINHIAEITTAEDEFIPFEPEQVTPINICLETLDILEKEKTCCICIESIKKSHICQLSCNHQFCSQCTLLLYIKRELELCCPLCRTVITDITVQTTEIQQTFIM